MTNSILLQIVNASGDALTDTTQAIDTALASAGTALEEAGTAIAPAVDELSLLDLILTGGIVMIPMGILSIMTIYYFVERFLTIKASAKSEDTFIPNIKDMIVNGNIDGAKSLCSSSKDPSAPMIAKGIARIGNPMKEIESAMESVGKLTVNRLEKNLNVLSLIGRIAPIMGFVGTIIGVIKIFYNIALDDNISIGAISEGLYEKMITSASGLLIGLVAFIGYYVLNSMLDRIINKMEESSIEFMDVLHEPTK